MPDNNLPDVQDKDVADDKAPETQTPEKEGNQTFKTFEDALEGYKNVQGAFTKATQENKQLREQLEQIQEQMSLMQYGPQHPQQQAYEDFDSQYIQDPQKAITLTAQQQIQQTLIAEAIDELQLENPAEFQERYAYAKMLAGQYPQLTTSRTGIKKLFQMGDKYRDEERKRNASRAIRDLFGDDVDVEQLKQLVVRKPDPTQDNNQAYMPDTTQSRGTVPEPSSKNVIDDAVQKGDAEKVLAELFKA